MLLQIHHEVNSVVIFHIRRVDTSLVRQLRMIWIFAIHTNHSNAKQAYLGSSGAYMQNQNEVSEKYMLIALQISASHFWFFFLFVCLSGGGGGQWIWPAYIGGGGGGVSEYGQHILTCLKHLDTILVSELIFVLAYKDNTIAKPTQSLLPLNKFSFILHWYFSHLKLSNALVSLYHHIIAKSQMTLHHKQYTDAASLFLKKRLFGLH